MRKLAIKAKYGRFAFFLREWVKAEFTILFSNISIQTMHSWNEIYELYIFSVKISTGKTTSQIIITNQLIYYRKYLNSCPIFLT